MLSLAFRFAVLPTLILTAGLPAVSAQEEAESLFDRDRNISVGERRHPGYTSEGIQRGALLFTPGIALGLERSLNVFATDEDEQSDIVAVINPSLDVETTWSRHELSAGASVTRRQFFDLTDESVWHWTLEGAGRLDIRRDTFFEGGLSTSRLTEARTEAGEASRTAEPLEFDRFDAFVGAQRPFGRFLVQGQVALREFDYDDGLRRNGDVVDQDFRDYVRPEVTFRTDYALSPDTAVFGRVRVNERNYDLEPPAVALQRDSSGYTIDGGADFDIRGVARGLLGIGYTEQDYDSASLSTISGASIDGLVEWFPTQLTTIAFEASRDVREAPFEGSGGYFETSAGVNIDHELRRNIILSAGASFVEDDYQDIDRIDERVTLDAGVTYVLNRWIGVRVGWTHIDQDRGGAAADRGYTASTFGFSLVRP